MDITYIATTRTRAQTKRKEISYVIWNSSLYLQKLALTSPTSAGRSVGIVRPRTQTMEFSFVVVDMKFLWSWL
jgi:hypothetical protein